jgi:acyl-CoA thioester hydrolase
MERARTEWLRAIGMEQQALAEQTGVRFTITRMEIDFLAPARLDDLLQITVHLSKPGRASLTLEQRILREPDRCLMARAIVRVACIDSHFRPTRLPTPLKHLPRGEHTP